MQVTVILSNLIAIYGRSWLYDNYEIIREGSIPLRLSKNKLCATKVVAKNGLQCKLLPQRAPS